MLHLIIGGAGSGKSAYAEKIIVESGAYPHYYVATMQPFGKEALSRIERHRKLRAGKGFETLERQISLSKLELPEDGCAVLLECVGNLLANEMYDPAGSKEACIGEIVLGVKRLAEQAKCVAVVTNDVFSDGNTYDAETMRYIAYLGEVNRRLAELADRVTEVVCGIPLARKGSGFDAEDQEYFKNNLE